MSSNVRQQTFVENYQDWSVYTSVKPLRNVATFNQLHCRLFWIAIVLAGIGACTYQTVTIVQEYLQYVRNTNVQFQDTIGSTFPAVTICNLNPIRLNALDSISELQKLEAVYQYLTSDAYQEGDDTNSTSDTDDDDGLSKKKREAGFESSKPVQIASKKKDKAVDGYSTIMTRDELYDMPDEHQLISRKKRAADADVYVSGTPCVLTPTVTTTVSPFECNIDVWLTTTAEPTTTIEPTTTDLTTTVEPTTTDLTTTELTTTEASTTIESTTTESTTTESTTTESTSTSSTSTTTASTSTTLASTSTKTSTTTKTSTSTSTTPTSTSTKASTTTTLTTTPSTTKASTTAKTSTSTTTPASTSTKASSTSTKTTPTTTKTSTTTKATTASSTTKISTTPTTKTSTTSTSTTTKASTTKKTSTTTKASTTKSTSTSTKATSTSTTPKTSTKTSTITTKKPTSPTTKSTTKSTTTKATTPTSTKTSTTSTTKASTSTSTSTTPRSSSSSSTSTTTKSTTASSTSSSTTPLSSSTITSSSSTSTTPKSITTSTTSTSSTTASTTTKSTTEGFDVTSLPIVQTKNYTTSELNELIDYFGLNKSSSRVALEAQVQDLMQTIIANLDPATLESAGYSLGDLVISCSFDTTPCDYENDFTKVTDPDYGNCYTYNANGTHKTARSGSAYGLRLITFSNVSDYLASSSCAGMRITISKQNFAVFPNTYGYDVAVGRYVLVAVGYDDIERLGHPYNNCTQKDDTEGSIYDGYYTYEGCVRTCFQQSLLANCSCVDSRFPKVSEDDVYCSYNNTEEFECYQNYINVNGDYTQTQNCSCASPCSDAQYSAVLTTAAWPTYFPNFTTPQCTGTYPGTDVDCYTAYTENAVAVDVMFANSEYEVTTESPNMNGYDLFRNISGAISLWIGASVITLFELLELLLYLCFSKKLCGPCKPRPDSAFADGSSSNDDIYDNDGDNELPPPIVDGGGMGFNSLDGPFGGDYNPAEGSGARARKVPSRFVSD